MHPSPIRMWIFVLEGEMHFEASNGEARHIKPGSALLLEDTEGQGHFSRVVGARAVTLAVVRLPQANAA
jgi:quercetin dioxygenase-like cupin family protein